MFKQRINHHLGIHITLFNTHTLLCKQQAMVLVVRVCTLDMLRAILVALVPRMSRQQICKDYSSFPSQGTTRAVAISFGSAFCGNKKTAN